MLYLYCKLWFGGVKLLYHASRWAKEQVNIQAISSQIHSLLKIRRIYHIIFTIKVFASFSPISALAKLSVPYLTVYALSCTNYRTRGKAELEFKNSRSSWKIAGYSEAQVAQWVYCGRAMELHQFAHFCFLPGEKTFLKNVSWSWQNTSQSPELANSIRFR